MSHCIDRYWFSCLNQYNLLPHPSPPQNSRTMATEFQEEIFWRLNTLDFENCVWLWLSLYLFWSHLSWLKWLITALQRPPYFLLCKMPADCILTCARRALIHPQVCCSFQQQWFRGCDILVYLVWVSSFVRTWCTSLDKSIFSHLWLLHPEKNVAVAADGVTSLELRVGLLWEDMREIATEYLLVCELDVKIIYSFLSSVWHRVWLGVDNTLAKWYCNWSVPGMPVGGHMLQRMSAAGRQCPGTEAEGW